MVEKLKSFLKKGEAALIMSEENISFFPVFMYNKCIKYQEDTTVRTQQKSTHDPKLQAHIEKQEKHDHRLEHIFRRILHWIERLIALITILVMLCALAIELFQMFTTPGYLEDISKYLHNVLTIVVGLEFVRMLIDLTPANTLEVLIVAISRQVILNHNDPLGNVACVLCIAGLFATRRFLIRKQEMKVEMSEVE